MSKYIIKFNISFFADKKKHKIDGEFEVKDGEKIFSESDSRLYTVVSNKTAELYFLTCFKNAQLLYLNPNFITEFIDISHINSVITKEKIVIDEIKTI